MQTITATVHYPIAPAWALLQRRLIDMMDEAVHPYVAKYANEDGSLKWADSWSGSRDGMDDFYEAFHNFAQFYSLGGGDHLLQLADYHWDGITRQLTKFGRIHKEYERGYDQFHQCESYIYFYHLCLANPGNAKLVERARRFAGFYLNEDPEAQNYDPVHKIIRAPHNGSGGPAWGMSDDDSKARYGWTSGSMNPYGMPLTDVPGIERYEDLKDPAKARQMGQAMAARFREGDVGNNLNVNGLIMNAYLISGEAQYKDWLLEYVGAWLERARDNGGLMPDNVGLDGKVGTLHSGKWYGGLYGWTWPHGFYNLGYAAITAANNAYMLSGDTAYLELPRQMLDRVLEQGMAANFDEMAPQMSVLQHYIGVDRALGASRRTFLTPFRYGDQGWMDYQPMQLSFPLNIWNVTEAEEDWARIDFLRQRSGYDWSKVVPFRDKGDMNHDEPWVLFLKGEKPEYPEEMLGATYAQVCHRLAQMRADRADLAAGPSIHLWQQLQPVVTEALVQLTQGCPQVVYYGGMLNARLRYFCAQRQRPGLPADVAALVDTIEPRRVAVQLVNTSPTEERAVVVQAGGLGEHRFGRVRFDASQSVYPGPLGEYAADEPVVETEQLQLDDGHVRVVLPPATKVRLDFQVERFAHTPSYAGPDYNF
ncbi:MAG: hypothetical protein GKR89_04025 [Candidatus Latescibacteria bacterium]|nr:hypothetical protein [Candidatus Latescibacterota bacterium]